MKIVIDMQGAQSPSSANRGIGQYTMAITRAMARNAGEHDIHLVLNGAFPERIDFIRNEMRGLIPQSKMHVWHPPIPCYHLDASSYDRRKAAERLREAFIASLSPDIIFITSLFEGAGDNLVTSIGEYDSRTPVAVIVYDLIPHFHRPVYFNNSQVELWYDEKLQYLSQAELLLAISDSTRSECQLVLGVPEASVVNLSAAAKSTFRPKQYSQESAKNILKQYNIHRSFILYTGGIDHRKNIEGLIRGYAALKPELIQEFQLVIVCAIDDNNRRRLLDLATEMGLQRDDVIITGFVQEEHLLALYNLCHLFVFPSWHEGFGLPILEAMSCGRAVIAANSSSLPEVIGYERALFEPDSDVAITEKLEEVLVDDCFRKELEAHGLERAKLFSWDNSARKALSALETFHEGIHATKARAISPNAKPKLAYVSPLPPAPSGISDYSAELISELVRHYDIDLIVDQDEVSYFRGKFNCEIRDLDWFRKSAANYDRVVYQFGNSDFHSHMFSLLEEIPGVVTLHDFFLSHIVAHMDIIEGDTGSWVKELYLSHGYVAVAEHARAEDISDIIWKYPCNISVLQNAFGVIVHSDYSHQLAKYWYGRDAAENWIRIPLLRRPATQMDRARARARLGFQNDDFVICSFGMLAITKMSDRLLHNWLDSELAKSENSRLVFVGQRNDDAFGQKLAKDIQDSSHPTLITVTGRVEEAIYCDYLCAADLAVQLRSKSRGETSAAILDCMNYGLPLIVNKNGSIAELPDDAAFKLPDEFEDSEFIEALELLAGDPEKRNMLGKNAIELIRKKHAPRMCAELYAATIEKLYEVSPLRMLTKDNTMTGEAALKRDLDEAIDRSFLPAPNQKQLLIDISELVVRDSRSGIQRVVRSILMHWIYSPPKGYRVEPVYATKDEGYKYAREFTCKMLEIDDMNLDDQTIRYKAGDCFVGLDLQPQIVSERHDDLISMRRAGVHTIFVVYDLSCITTPQYFDPGVGEGMRAWLETVTQADELVCISRSVADEVKKWVEENVPHRAESMNISWFHLGADVESSVPTHGLEENAEAVLAKIMARPTFLMVGTIEPRKGHENILKAVEWLRNRGEDINLAIVGKEGWLVDDLMQTIREHPGLNDWLFYCAGASDEYLQLIYENSSVLVAASYAEGFGLPLIEAARHGLPVIARDIPVFREVAGEAAYYFSGTQPEETGVELRRWLQLYKKHDHARSYDMEWLSWSESADTLLHVIGCDPSAELANSG